MDVKEEDILGERVADHWYYRAKGRMMLSTLGRKPRNRVLDVGAGSGVFSKLMLDGQRADEAICVDPAYREEFEEDRAGRRLAFRREKPSDDADLVLMMDVLEHVDDDLGLLKAYSDDLPSRAEVFITVTAFQSLWSGHDVFLEHRRRYRLEEVEDLVQRAGLEVSKGRYFYGGLFPVAFWKRGADRKKLQKGELEAKSDLAPAPAWLNGLLVAAHEVERLVVYPWNRTAGLSVVCLARKP